MSRSSAFELLDTKVRRWVWSQGWDSLRDIQESAIPIVLRADADVIISASTAGGKTEAAFLPILSRILRDGATDGYSVLYISPLKALINDQYRRLSEMTAGMGIDVIPWHGDIDASRKQKSLKHPNGIVIITPESLESFLINRRQHLDRAFSSLKYVVIDELHSFIGNERGKQLQSLLSRLEIITKQPVPRIAMSATFSSYNVVTQFLRPDSALPCRIPPEGESNHEIKILVKEYVPTKDYDPGGDIVTELYTKLRGDNHLVFANSRINAENYAVDLSDMCEQDGVPNEFRVHHGSLSKLERESVEHDLQKGEKPVTALCTSTLELGVDIGKVKSIVQVGCAHSVSSLRQRLGRSGRRNEPSILRVLSIENPLSPIFYDLRASLIQNIAIVELLRDKQYETPATEKLHLSTLIQQILSILSQYGAFYPKDGWQILCQNGAFRNVTVAIFLDLLRALGEQDIISQLHNGQIIIGKEGEKIVKQTDFYVAFWAEPEFAVINRYNSKRVGMLQSAPAEGEMIVIAAKRWIVESVDLTTRSVYVNRIRSGGAANFSGGGAEIDRIITERMRQIYNSPDTYPYLDIQTDAPVQLNHARTLFQKSCLATSNFITYGNKTLCATWAGAKINRTISLMMKYSLGITTPYDYIFIGGITLATLKELITKGKPQPNDLAAQLPKEHKIQQKHDRLLTEELINHEYASSSLDVDGAWEVISNLLTPQ